jgi:hypothetical protein
MEVSIATTSLALAFAVYGRFTIQTAVASALCGFRLFPKGRLSAADAAAIIRVRIMAFLLGRQCRARG